VDELIATALADYVEHGVAADTDITEAVMRRTGGRRRSFPVRLRWAVVGAVALASVTAVAALAVATGNLPVKVGPGATTLAAAEHAFGTHVLTPSVASGAVLEAAYFTAATPSNAQRGTPASPATVALLYRDAGALLDVTEVIDPTSAPLTVDALGPGGAKLKAAHGLGPVTIETHSGSRYVVGRSADGASVEWIVWKSATGVVVTAHFSPGLAHDAALTVAGSFQ
jgi:hypothetical protein